jgi:hypothetical protein
LTSSRKSKYAPSKLDRTGHPTAAGSAETRRRLQDRPPAAAADSHFIWLGPDWPAIADTIRGLLAASVTGRP